MRIVFAGTPEFAVPALRALAAARHEIALVVSQPDRPRGRGRALEPTPVKKAAAALGLRVVQPEKVGEIAGEIKTSAPDVLVTAAYGQKIPEALLRIPRFSGLNVHASLLPRHRGAAPVAFAILSGDERTGITIFRMAKRMDAGPVLARATLDIRPAETAGELEARLADLAAPTLLGALSLLESGQARFEEQDHAKATLAPKLKKEAGEIAWTRDATALARLVRAMQPWPGAVATLARGKVRTRVTILAAAPIEERLPGRPGDVIGVSKQAIRVRCGIEGALDLLRLQPESRKPMSADEFANGFRLREEGGASFVVGMTIVD